MGNAATHPNRLARKKKKKLFHLAILIDILPWEMKILREKRARAFFPLAEDANKCTCVCGSVTNTDGVCPRAFASVGCMGAIVALAASFWCHAQFEYANHPLDSRACACAGIHSF